VVNAYQLAVMVALLPLASFGDIFGYRRVYRVGLVVYTGAALISALAGGDGLPRLDTSRLRATWLAEVAQLLGVATFLHAAGITCSQRLGDITATLQPGDEAEAVALLGGQR